MRQTVVNCNTLKHVTLRIQQTKLLLRTLIHKHAPQFQAWLQKFERFRRDEQADFVFKVCKHLVTLTLKISMKGIVLHGVSQDDGDQTKLGCKSLNALDDIV